MSFPIYLEIGTTKILLHVVAEIAAFFLGFRYFMWLRRKEGDTIRNSNRTWIIIGAAFGSFLGSRLIGGFEDPEQVGKADNLFLYFYQNKTVLGGFLGGLFGVELIKKIIGEKQASGDLFVYPLLLALIIGRMGCFSMGIYEETYGTITTVPWGMDLGDGNLRHPVMIYEIIFLLLLWSLLFVARNRQTLKQGALFKLFMISYFLFRFLIDFIKPHYNYIFDLSLIQITALSGLFYYSPFLIRPKKLLKTSYA
ncbi:MAG TPA: prolipoprotein diacylglyceryl transferase family protein [Chitinophagaceae bacterium]